MTSETLPTANQSNQAPNVAKKDQKPKQQKVFLFLASSSNTEPSESRTIAAAGISALRGMLPSILA
jgi:hypothetical protein